MTARVVNRKPPTVGPYGETYTDRAGLVRARLTDEGRRLCGEWMSRHPHPVALVMRVWPRLYHAARDCGLSDADLDSAAMEGVVKSFLRYDPARGCQVQTVVTWGVRGAVGDVLRRRLQSIRELSVSQFDYGEECYLRTPATGPDDGGLDDDRVLAVRHALTSAGLTARETELLGLSLEMTGRQAAKLTGVSHQCVANTRATAIHKLRIRLGLLGSHGADSKCRVRIARALSRFPDPVTACQIRMTVNFPSKRIRAELRRMAVAGLVTETREPRRGYRGGVAVLYRLSGLGQMTEGRATA